MGVVSGLKTIVLLKVTTDITRSNPSMTKTITALFEVLSRRARWGIEEGDLPDLMVIDGKGQLAAAHAALRDHGIEDIVLISIAKSRSKGDTRSSERIFRLNAKSALTLKRGSKEFMLLTSIRDEAHCFAIEFHRKLRSKASKVRS